MTAGAKSGRWALIVHGGAKEMAADEEQDNRDGVLQALDAGRRILEGGGSALDAAEAAVRAMEDLPVFNAGLGSALTEEGRIEMSAGIMDGKDRRVGAIAYVGTLKHPVSVAKALLPEKWVLLVGDGAVEFAEAKGAEFCDMASLITRKNREALKESKDTVGAVALDQGGNLAVASGTGGLSGAHAGRVSDTAMPGCGYYADNHLGAVAFSGDGESIARVAAASMVMQRMLSEGPQAAIRAAIDELPLVGGREGDGGAIAIDRDGRLGWDHNSPDFAVALITSEMDAPKAWLRKDEDG